MRTGEEYRIQFNLSNESDDTVSSRIDDIDAAINEARKETAIEFFKWNASHISEYLDYLRRVDYANGTSDYEKEMDFYEKTTIEGRYNEFLKQNKLQ